jgi:hypothetical protein
MLFQPDQQNQARKWNVNLLWSCGTAPGAATTRTGTIQHIRGGWNLQAYVDITRMIHQALIVLVAVRDLVQITGSTHMWTVSAEARTHEQLADDAEAEQVSQQVYQQMEMRLLGICRMGTRASTISTGNGRQITILQQRVQVEQRTRGRRFLGLSLQVRATMWQIYLMKPATQKARQYTATMIKQMLNTV